MREEIYYSLREDIFLGRIKPGERLLESELTKAYKVSRTPVREVIQRLRADGLVTVISQKGATVSKLSAEEEDEIFAIRGILESHAVKLAADKIKKADLKKIIKMQEALRRNASEMNYIEYLKNNMDFHFFFPKISGNKSLFNIIKHLRIRVFGYQYIKLTFPGNLHLWLDGHQKIIDALIDNDAELAAKSMEKHIQDIRKVTFDFLKNFHQSDNNRKEVLL